MLGNGCSNGDYGTPADVTGVSGLTATNLCGGSGTFCAAYSDNTIKCWGRVDAWGSGFSQSSYRTPSTVLSNAGSQIACSRQFACGASSNNDLYCWGQGLYDGATPVKRDLGSRKVRQLAGGMNVEQFCVTLDDDSMMCSGYDSPDGWHSGLNAMPGTYPTTGALLSG